MQARAKPEKLIPCPLCRSEVSVKRVQAIRGRLSEWACYCSTCLYISVPQIGKMKAIMKHNEDWPGKTYSMTDPIEAKLYKRKEETCRN